MIDHGDESREALAWLEQNDGKERRISDNSEDQLAGDDLLRLVKELYEAGAVEVRVTGLTIEDDFEDGDGLEILLPEGQAERAELFALAGRVLREISSAFDQDTEQGQALTRISW